MANENSPDNCAAHFFTEKPTPQKNAALDSPLISIQAVEPEEVPILITDPRINDAPQLESTTEWYYLQAHLQNGSSTSSDDPEHTVFVCLFRQSTENELESATEHNWGVIYATLDWQTQKYATYSRVPPTMPKYASKSLEGNHSPLSEAIRTMINAGPKSEDIAAFIPDGIFSSPVQICQSADGKGPALHLEWDNGAYLIGENGSYRLKVPQIELDIQVHASRPIMLHGNNGETLNDKKVCILAAIYHKY